MIRRLPSVCFVALLLGVAYPQSPEPRSTFEAADVHTAPLTPNLGGRSGQLHGSRYEMKSATMVDLVTAAYGVDYDKVLGGPTWLELDRFDVIAKAPANTTPEALKLMLQSLLADRFQLVARPESKSLPAYALKVGKHLSIKQADGSEETGCKQSLQGLPSGPVDGAIDISSLTMALSCRNTTMAAFLDRMPMPRQSSDGGLRPVLDQTGLQGAWNFDFKFALGAQGDIASLSAELDKQIGLTLDLVMIPQSVVRVERANRTPTPNGPEVAQAFPPLPTEFDVAEIKPSDPSADSGPIMLNGGMVMVARKEGGRGGGRGGPGQIQNGRVNLQGYTLKMLINVAWNINSPDKLVGAPKFTDSDKYDVIAKVPAGAADAFSDIDSIRPLLRALLIERFKMVVHNEDRPVPTFVLSAAKPKLKPADPAARTRFYEGPAPDTKDPRNLNSALSRLVTCQNMTMAELAALLNNIASGYIQGQPVLNETGLEGAWDFTLNFSVAGMVGGGGGGRGMVVFRGGDAGPAGGNSAASDPSGGLSLNDALTKQLGLKLETIKRTAPVVVIDHMEQKPTDN